MAEENLVGYCAIGTPKALHDRYRSLSVLMPNGTLVHGIDIHEYKNNGSNTEDFKTASDITEGWRPLWREIKKHGKEVGSGKYELVIRFDMELPTAWDGTSWLSAKVASVGVTETLTQKPLQRVYLGKGTPADIEKALQLAVYFGLCPAEKSAIQSYCDQNIGIDCSGLTGAYYGTPYYPQGSKSYRRLGVAITRLEDIQQDAAMVWLNTNHIAVIDRVVSTEKTGSALSRIECMVVESTGSQMTDSGPSDGLAYSKYIIETRRENFYVTRTVVKRDQLKEQHPNVTIRKLL